MFGVLNHGMVHINKIILCVYWYPTLCYTKSNHCDVLDVVKEISK